jgi:arylsulfatase A-like enzyme
MKPLLFSLVLVLATLVSGPQSEAADAAEVAKRPNIVLFLVDDMGWMDSEPYGSQYYETPNMVRLARESMRFTDAYAVPLCSPTRASIQSGQYSARHGVTTASGHQPAAPEGASRYPEKAPPTSRYLYPISKNFLDPAIPTVAEVLREAGYRTGHFGKWHLGTAPEHRPERRGYETAWYCVPDPGPPSYFSPYGVQAEGRPTGQHKVGTVTDGPEGEYITDRLADEVVAFLEAHRDEPFFLNLCQYAVHGPWGHKEVYTAEFASKTDPRGEQRNPIMASMFRSVDECLGRVLDKLDELGIAEDTLFVFYSDNGGNVHSNREDDRKLANIRPGHPRHEFVADWRKWAGGEGPTNNAPLREGKASIYEGGQRVPLMVRWPGRVAPGSTSGAVVTAVDLFPTFLDAAGLEAPDGHVVDGLSLLPVLEGEGGLGREAVFTWFPHQIPAASVRAGDWKLIYRWEPHARAPEVRELYHLGEDLGETRNLAGEHPDKVAELEALLERFIAETGAAAPLTNPAWSGEVKDAAPAAAKAKTVEGAMAGLVPRQCEAELVDGALRVTASGPAPFLGTAQARFEGPLRVVLELRAASAGKGRLHWKAEGQDDFPPEAQSVDYSLQGGGEWESVALVAPVEGRCGTLRIHLPAARGGSVEIRSIEIGGADGRIKRWQFGG